MKMIDDPEILDRAISAFYHTRKKNGLHDVQPANSSYVAEVDNKQYVVLGNVNGILAVYRIKNDGYLKRLKRWPEEIRLLKTTIEESCQNLIKKFERLIEERDDLIEQYKKDGKEIPEGLKLL